MVELGDLREGVLPADLVPLALEVAGLRGLSLAGIGANLACQSGVAPDQDKMQQLSDLAVDVEAAVGMALSVVSGGNSANLGWALGTGDTGRIDDLRLGEAILLGLDPLTRLPVFGLRTDAVVMVAELIEVRVKPASHGGGSPRPRSAHLTSVRETAGYGKAFWRVGPPGHRPGRSGATGGRQGPRHEQRPPRGRPGRRRLRRR